MAAAGGAGCVAIVTGANTGLGFATVKKLSQGPVSHIILACRSESSALAAIRALQPGTACRLEFMQLDLSSLRSVRAFAAAFEAKGLPLNILVNNAGGNYQKARTADGLEW
jgi:NAD(P)-dependent dehydrogenase (short-subunit alcohol dehydrogenase family)